MREEDFSFFEEEDFKENLARYEAMLNGGPSAYLEGDELTDIAEYYLSHGEPEKANACIDYALTLHPDSVDPLIFKARQHMFSGQLSQAQDICDSIQEQNDREVIFLHAELLIRKQHTAEAIRFLRERKEYFSDNRKDLYTYLYDCACILEDYAHYDKALEWADEAERISGPNLNIQFLKAEIYSTQENFEKATELLEKILDEDPYSLKSWNMLADTYFMREMYDKAIEAAEFSLAIKEKENPEALFAKANCLYHLGNFEEAHRLYSQYIHDFPKTDEYPYLFDGLCLNQMERYEDACSRLESAEKYSNDCSPEQLQIYLQLSFAYSKVGKFQKALHYLDRAQNYDPEGFDYNVLKGHILLENGFTQEALEYFQKAKEESTEGERTYFLIAVSLFENRMYADALENFNELLDFCSPQTEINCNPYLAYCFYYAKDEIQYLKYLERSCETNPEGTKMVLGHLFPESLNPKEYYAYLMRHDGLQ